jgi:WD40 repeat protein
MILISQIRSSGYLRYIRPIMFIFLFFICHYISAQDFNNLKISQPKEIFLNKDLNSNSANKSGCACIATLQSVINKSGTILAVLWNDCTIKLWDLNSSSLIRTFDKDSDDVSLIAISPDSKQIVTGSFNKNVIKFRDIKTGSLVKTMSETGMGITSIAISDDGKRIISSGQTKQILIWDIDKGMVIQSIDNQSAKYSSKSDFSPDGTLIAVSNGDGTIKIWSVNKSSYIYTFYTTMTGLSTCYPDFKFSPDGMKIITVRSEITQQFDVWSLITGKVVRNISSGCYLSSGCYSPDGTMYAGIIENTEFTINLWDIKTGFTRKIVIIPALSRYIKLFVSNNILKIVSFQKDSISVKEICNFKDAMNYYYSLSQNYPNPFNSSTIINFELPVSGCVTLKIFDLLGKEIKTLINDYKSAGRYSVEWIPENQSGGIYFYKLEAGKYKETGKMLFLK